MKRGSTIILMLIIDSFLIFTSYLVSFIIRFNFDINDDIFISYFDIFISKFVLILLIKLILISFFRLYKVVWKFATTTDFIRVIASLFVSNIGAITYLEITNTNTAATFPRGVYLECFIIEVILFVGLRLIYRLLINRSSIKGEKRILKKKSNVLIIGGGDAGATIIKELKSNFVDKHIVGILDDDKKLHGCLILGCKVIGKIETVRGVSKRFNVDEIYIAIPSLSKKRLAQVVLDANKTLAKVLTLPSLSDLINGKVTINTLKPISINDLLGRDPINLDIKTISSYISGKVVFISGAGGSIGSEIARVTAEFMPRKIILFDNYENSLFEIEQELLSKYDDIEIIACLGTLRSKYRLNEIFEEYKPHIVFHAGAHKHVPLLENNVREAILNNILGTKNIVDASSKHLAEKFILISTDKAVNPTSVMGASKRLAEVITIEKNRVSSTSFSLVRFGNVLNSNGSVIRIFRKNIENNLPLTVTSPDIKRYFMTINEAASLVVQAGALADEDNRIFILDMGDPIRILDLAENIVKLSGLEPYKDIDIKISNVLRKGEKLEEQLSHEGENLSKTKYKKINVATPLKTRKEILRALEGNGEVFEKVINEYVFNLNSNETKEWLNKVIPEYTPDFLEVNSLKIKSKIDEIKDEEIEDLSKILEKEKKQKEELNSTKSSEINTNKNVKTKDKAHKNNTVELNNKTNNRVFENLESNEIEDTETKMNSKNINSDIDTTNHYDITNKSENNSGLDSNETINDIFDDLNEDDDSNIQKNEKTLKKEDTNIKSKRNTKFTKESKTKKKTNSSRNTISKPKLK